MKMYSYRSVESERSFSGAARRCVGLLPVGKEECPGGTFRRAVRGTLHYHRSGHLGLCE